MANVLPDTSGTTPATATPGTWPCGVANIRLERAERNACHADGLGRGGGRPRHGGATAAREVSDPINLERDTRGGGCQHAHPGVAAAVHAGPAVVGDSLHAVSAVVTRVDALDAALPVGPRGAVHADAVRGAPVDAVAAAGTAVNTCHTALAACVSRPVNAGAIARDTLNTNGAARSVVIAQNGGQAATGDHSVHPPAVERGSLDTEAPAGNVDARHTALESLRRLSVDTGAVAGHGIGAIAPGGQPLDSVASIRAGVDAVHPALARVSPLVSPYAPVPLVDLP